MYFFLDKLSSTFTNGFAAIAAYGCFAVPTSSKPISGFMREARNDKYYSATPQILIKMQRIN